MEHVDHPDALRLDTIVVELRAALAAAEAERDRARSIIAALADQPWMWPSPGSPLAKRIDAILSAHRTRVGESPDEPQSEAQQAAAPPPVEVGQVRRSPSGEEWTVMEVGQPREPWIALSMPPKGRRCGVARSQSLSVVATWPLVPAPPAEEE